MNVAEQIERAPRKVGAKTLDSPGLSGEPGAASGPFRSRYANDGIRSGGLPGGAAPKKLGARDSISSAPAISVTGLDRGLKEVVAGLGHYFAANAPDAVENTQQGQSEAEK